MFLTAVFDFWTLRDRYDLQFPVLMVWLLFCLVLVCIAFRSLNSPSFFRTRIYSLFGVVRSQLLIFFVFVLGLVLVSWTFISSLSSLVQIILYPFYNLILLFFRYLAMLYTCTIFCCSSSYRLVFSPYLVFFFLILVVRFMVLVCAELLYFFSRFLSSLSFRLPCISLTLSLFPTPPFFFFLSFYPVFAYLPYSRNSPLIRDLELYQPYPPHPTEPDKVTIFFRTHKNLTMCPFPVSVPRNTIMQRVIELVAERVSCIYVADVSSSFSPIFFFMYSEL